MLWTTFLAHCLRVVEHTETTCSRFQGLQSGERSKNSHLKRNSDSHSKHFRNYGKWSIFDGLPVPRLVMENKVKREHQDLVDLELKSCSDKVKQKVVCWEQLKAQQPPEVGY